MRELLNEKSKSYKILSYTLATLGLVSVVVVFMSIYDVIGEGMFLIGLWGWMLTFGGFLVHRGISDMFYLKRKDGIMYLIIPLILLIIVIWLTTIR